MAYFTFPRLTHAVRLPLAIALGAGLALGATGAMAQSQTTKAAPAASGTTASTSAPAPQTIDPKAVVATVGGETITEADISFAAEDMAQDLANVPANQRKAFLTTVLIDMKMMAEAARAENLQNTDTFKQRLKYLEDRALRRAYFADKIAPGVNDAAVKAAYDKMVADFKPQEEVHVRHILVKTEAEAKKVRAEIENGKPFQVAAMESSIDTGTAKNGGDLGFITRGRTVKPFEDAAFSLKVGTLSQPVKSQFGWHLIKVEAKQKTTPPKLAQVKAQLQQKVMIDAFNAALKKLKANAKVSFTDPNMAAAVAAEQKRGIE